jgi:hypothetical protein
VGFKDLKIKVNRILLKMYQSGSRVPHVFNGVVREISVKNQTLAVQFIFCHWSD